MSDDELIEEYKKGDNEALGELWKRHEDKVLKRAMRSLPSRSDAEEVTGDVALNLIESVKRYDPNKGSYDQLLNTIVRHRINDFYRRRGGQRNPPTESGIKTDGTGCPETSGKHGVRPRVIYVAVNNSEIFESQVDEKQKSPVEQSLDDETKGILTEAINKALNCREKKAFCLFLYYRVSQADIATEMGTTVDAVKNLIKKAKRKIGKYLKINYPRHSEPP